MHPAEMSDCLDDLNTPDVTVTCPPHLRAPVTRLLEAMTDMGDLRNYIYALDVAGPPSGRFTVSGRSAPALVVRQVLEGLGYTVRVTQVTA